MVGAGEAWESVPRGPAVLIFPLDANFCFLGKGSTFLKKKPCIFQFWPNVWLASFISCSSSFMCVKDGRRNN